MAAGTLTFVGAAQAEPEVTAEDVEAAFHDVETVAEQVNALDEKIDAAQAQIADLDDDVAAQQRLYEEQRTELGATIVQQQMDAPLGPTVNLLGSEDPQEFLEGLGAVQALNSTRADALEDFTRTARELENRQAKLRDRVAELKRTRTELDEKRAEMRSGYEEARDQLEQLSQPEQATFNASNDQVKVTAPGDASARAKQIIAFASSQLGDPYVYGGTGPDGWDCSGLVQASYAAAGVSLPRVVGPQYAAMTSVPIGQAQPGDVVFFPDMSHDGIYIGNGQVIHAPRPGKNVEVTTLGIGFTLAGRV